MLSDIRKALFSLVQDTKISYNSLRKNQSPGQFSSLADLADLFSVDSSAQVRLEVNLVDDEDLTERALLLGIVGLQFRDGLIVATLDRQLESLLTNQLQLKQTRFFQNYSM